MAIIRAFVGVLMCCGAFNSVAGSADLRLSNFSSDAVTSLGDFIHYRLTVYNKGLSAATDVVLTDTLPQNCVLQNANCSQGTCTLNTATVECELGSVAYAASAYVDVTVQSTAAGETVNVARVACTSPDPNLANNESTATTIVNDCPQVCVSGPRQWTWVKGTNVAGVIAQYGTRGVENVANTPGARYSNVGWTDSAGCYWCFGGNMYGNGYNGMISDLWRFNVATNCWAWLAGPQTQNQYGVYGTRGVASASNTPGARVNAMRWQTNDGKLWLFGGMGFSSQNDGAPINSSLNDLWQFDIATQQWTWMKGSNLHNQESVFGTRGVASSANTPGARFSGLTWTDNHGNLWLYGGRVSQVDLNYNGYFSDLWKYDVTSGDWTWYGDLSDPVAAAGTWPGYRISDSAAWTGSDGNLWLFGGTIPLPRSDIWRYDIASGLWTCMAGANVINVRPYYIKVGVPAAENTPGSVAAGGIASWGDRTGGLWLVSHSQDLSDQLLWHFDTNTMLWTCEKRNGTASAIPGDQGIPDPANIPGIRNLSYDKCDTAVDPANQLWMFAGKNSTGTGWASADLWKFGPGVQPVSDLHPTITKADAETTVGSYSSVTVDVHNDGPTGAEEVSIQNVLSAPASVSLYSNGPGLVPVGGTATFNVWIAPKVAGLLTHEVVASSYSADFNQDNNATSHTIVVHAKPACDLGVDISTSESDPIINNAVHYTITARNLGPDVAPDVSVVVLNSDNSETYQSTQVTRGTVSPFYLDPTFAYRSWGVGNMAPGEVQTMVLTSTPNVIGTISDKVYINAAVDDPDTSTNATTLTQTVRYPVADLAIENLTTTTQAIVGDAVSYSFEVTNNGPDSAPTVYVIDDLHSALSFVSSTPAAVPYYTAWALPLGTITPHTKRTVSITCHVTTTGQVLNRPYVASNAIDPFEANDLTTAILTVLPQNADVSVTIGSYEESTTAGQEMTYSLMVQNFGPNTANSVVVTNATPAGSQLVQMLPGIGDYSVTSDTIEWQVGDLLAGQMSTATITVRPLFPGPLFSTAQANSTTVDFVPQNNSASIQVNIVPDVCPPLTLQFTTSCTLTSKVKRSGITSKLQAKAMVMLTPSAPPPPLNGVVGFYLSDDAEWDSGDVLVKLQKFKSPVTAHGRQVKITRIYPAEAQADGNFLLAILDPYTPLIPGCDTESRVKSSPVQRQ